MSEIILASQSPRRREMLEWVGLDFEVVPSAFDEDLIRADDIVDLVEELAVQKALVVAKKFPEAIIIGADTMVSLDEHQIGKAQDAEHAFQIIKQLSGTTHQITTGVAIVADTIERPVVFHETTEVTFRPLTDQEINEYLQTAIWQDKAGAYAVQEDPGKFVVGYDGSYTNVMGLPIPRLLEELENFDIYTEEDPIAIIEAQTGRRER